MRLFSIDILLLVLGAIYSVYSQDVIVDNSIGTASGNKYPTLSAAMAALVNPTTKELLYENSTITFLSSCAGKAQTLSNYAITGKNGAGTLAMMYAMPPETVNTFAYCSQMPILNLTNTSLLSLSNLDAFTVLGMTIQLNAVTTRNRLANIGTVNFTSFCFNNTEPRLGTSGKLSATISKNLSIEDAGRASFNNGIYVLDSHKTLWITRTTDVDINYVTMLVLANNRDQITAAFNISNTSPFSSTVTTYGMNVTCQWAALVVAPYLVYATNITTLMVNATQYTMCLLVQTATSQQSTFAAVNTENFYIDGLYMFNVTYGANPQKSR